MKKVFLALAVVVLTIVSCNKKTDAVNDQITDSVTVVDSTQVDSTQVDSVAVDTAAVK
jgi:uncharacterized lipoprotein NlpE involved in copper resistance